MANEGSVKQSVIRSRKANVNRTYSRRLSVNSDMSLLLNALQYITTRMQPQHVKNKHDYSI